MKATKNDIQILNQKFLTSANIGLKKISRSNSCKSSFQLFCVLVLFCQFINTNSASEVTNISKTESIQFEQILESDYIDVATADVSLCVGLHCSTGQSFGSNCSTVLSNICILYEKKLTDSVEKVDFFARINGLDLIKLPKTQNCGFQEYDGFSLLETKPIASFFGQQMEENGSLKKLNLMISQNNPKVNNEVFGQLAFLNGFKILSETSTMCNGSPNSDKMIRA